MRWSIRDFKGLRRAELNLEPGTLTILAGVNSSGKSSIVQSLLMSAQSLYHEGPVVLNGPLVRLGEAGDLVRTDSSSETIGLSIDYRLSDYQHPDDESRSLRAEIRLVPSPDGASLVVQRLVASDLAGAGVTVPLVLDHEWARSQDSSSALDSVPGGLTDAVHAKSLFSSDARVLRTYVLFSGILPQYLVQLRRPSEIALAYRRAIQPLLDQMVRGVAPSRILLDAVTELDFYTLFREFSRLLTESMRAADSIDPRLRGLLFDRSWSPNRFRDAWNALDDDARALAISHASGQRASNPQVVTPLFDRARRASLRPRGLLEALLEDTLGPTLTVLRGLSRELIDLADRVQYLGPLRDEPRVVWNQWNELTRGLPVGTRGEYSAAVLARSRDDIVRYTDPTGEVRQERLDVAVDDWLRFLDIGESITTSNHGKLGVGLEVTLSGQKRDLTAVGVGVSQALPLVVGMLSAPQSSLFIVEQPELHLHPAVQARLADFLANARHDITVVVETHSEALITRVRRRVAEGSIDKGQVQVVFVEPSEEGTETRELTFNEYGDLSEWPAGFLTSPDDDTSAILEANVKRMSGKP
ncbi:AAA family ATPase [Microbacterium sp. P03]|uniref:AAA family ATPase n=1 Tax=Microbacterium sp. P03 TaxID=3366946 RepID=UPI003746FA80